MIEDVPLEDLAAAERRPSLDREAMLKFRPDPIVRPVVGPSVPRHLEHETRHRRGAVHLASEPASMEPVDRSLSGRGHGRDQRQPAERKGDRSIVRIAGKRARCAVATGDDFALDRQRRAS